MANGDDIGETYSDDTGRWTLFPEYELEPGDYELWAYAYDPNTPPGYQEDAYYSEDSREVFVQIGTAASIKAPYIEGMFVEDQ